MHKSHPFRIFSVSALLTVVLGIIVLLSGGLSMLWVYAVLVLLEITFSFDNAVINSKILTKLNPWWQMLFLTVGIFFAVFVVRFLLPIVIVICATGLNFAEVIGLAIHHPALYAAELHHAGPIIDAFGGTFLLMIGLNYFVDRKKDIHWLTRTERLLSKFGNVPFIKLVFMLIVATVLYVTVAPALRETVAIASLLGIALHVGLEAASDVFEKRNKGRSQAKHLVGGAAFASFMYLQVLDASFSFDGVVGAFAITTSVLLIMAGLGAGALWVRSLTVYLVRTNTLEKYRYLEHGAHWAILVLGIVMLAKLYGVELAEWMTGSLGLVFVATATLSSILEKRKEKTSKTQTR